MSTRLADFVVDRRMLLVAALAAGAAWCLLRLIGLGAVTADLFRPPGPDRYDD